MTNPFRFVRKLLGFPARALLGTITHVSTSEPLCALTFDDGPHPEFTPRLLSILQEYKAHATFFMVGEAARKHPELVRQVAQAGHAIGNHSWDHPQFPNITARERRRQIRACEQALSPYGQRIFRPPYGRQNLASRLDALWLGYEVVTWNLESGDWYERDASLLADRLARGIQPGTVVCLHDAIFAVRDRTLEPQTSCQSLDSRESSLAAVKMLLDRVGHRFRFVTVPELLRYGRPVRRNWYVTCEADWSKLV